MCTNVLVYVLGKVNRVCTKNEQNKKRRSLNCSECINNSLSLENVISGEAKTILWSMSWGTLRRNQFKELVTQYVLGKDFYHESKIEKKTKRLVQKGGSCDNSSSGSSSRLSVRW